MKRAEEGKEKKNSFCTEPCFWPVGTDFTLNLICFSQKSTDNLEITILCLQSYLPYFFLLYALYQGETKVYIIYAIFCTLKQLIHTNKRLLINREQIETSLQERQVKNGWRLF